MSEVKTGSSEDPNVLVNAVIHERSFDNCASYIDHAKKSDDCEVGSTLLDGCGWVCCVCVGVVYLVMYVCNSLYADHSRWQRGQV